MKFVTGNKAKTRATTKKWIIIRASSMPGTRALCVEMGFYADISWEPRCNIEIRVCNMVTRNPRTREKKCESRHKAGQV